MKKLIIFLFLLFLNLFSLVSNTLTLKEKIFTTKNIIKLSDIVKEFDSSVPDMEILKINQFPYRINSSYVLTLLQNNDIFDVILIGDSTIVFYQDKEVDKDIENNVCDENNCNIPLKTLEDHIRSFINIKDYNLRLSLIDIKPFIDLNNINKNFRWELDKIKYGLKDIEKSNNFTLIVDDKKYKATVQIDIFTDILIAKQGFIKGDYFKLDRFYKKNVDVTSIDKIDSIAFNITDLKNTQFTKDIGVGEILRWSSLKINPTVKKGENINLVYKKNNIEIVLPSILLLDGYENQKVKVKLINGNEKSGTLKCTEGTYYVEIL